MASNTEHSRTRSNAVKFDQERNKPHIRNVTSFFRRCSSRPLGLRVTFIAVIYYMTMNEGMNNHRTLTLLQDKGCACFLALPPPPFFTLFIICVSTLANIYILLLKQSENTTCHLAPSLV